MRVCFAASICAWGYLACSGTAHAAELTDLASSFEPGKPFGFKVSAAYGFSYKTASITRESLPYFQAPQTMADLLSHSGGTLGRTQTVPDLLYTERKHTLSVRADIGLFQDLQLSAELPVVLQDVRSYDLDPTAGWNNCNPSNFGCIANSSSTYLDGIYPIDPNSQVGSTIFSPPFRGGGGLDALDTINLSLTGAPVSQRRDPTKPTWVIGLEGQISIGTIMQYDNTRLRLPANSPLVTQSDTDTGGNAQRGWNGVSEGLHRVIVRTAISHRFRYIDPYFGLWYMIPIARTGDGSPWVDYGFAQRRAAPQQQAGLKFGFEATPLENKDKGHRLVLDFRGAINVHFLGRGYSEAWELFASSSALVCDDATALPPPFNFSDAGARPDVKLNKGVTQGTFNPACRAPINGNSIPGYGRARLQDASPYYQHPYSGLTIIQDYLSFSGELGITAELYRHFRLRLSGNYLRDQGHVITADDAGTTNYSNRPATCNASRVDQNCPADWNPAYRAVINQTGRRYRVDDVNQFSGNATAQLYW